MLAAGALCAGTGLLLSSCVDDSYDLSHDLDLTMGLGSEGLSVKLGRTEQIFLSDLLDTDKSVKLDGNNVYYLVENGSTDMTFSVEDVTATVENSEISTAQRVLDFESFCQQLGADPARVSSVPVSGGTTFSGTAKSKDKENISFHLENVTKEIIRVDNAILHSTPVTISVAIKQTPNVKLAISRIHGMRIVMPEYLKVKDATKGTIEGNVLTLPDITNPANGELCRVTVYALDFGKDGLARTGSVMRLDDERSHVSFEGEVDFRTTQDFTLSAGDYADITMEVAVGDNHSADAHTTVSVENVTGRFNPAISPDIKPISIRGSLPSFLDDSEVKLGVSNPTLKFSADFSHIPADLNFSARLQAVKDGADGFTRAITLPSEGQSVTFEKEKSNTVYFHEGDTPYDPEGTAAGAQTVRVNGEGNRISSLIERLPDEINVDLKDGRLQVPQDKSYTIELAKDYTAKAEYKIFVPFEFSDGLAIVYRDTTETFGDDLKDYSASGVDVTATCVNTIPLDLVGKIQALDKTGKPLDGVHFGDIPIKAAADGATTTPVSVSATLDTPSDLGRIGSLVFRIEAASGVNEGTHRLCSTQYLRFNDIRLKLRGAVTADFN